MKTIWILTAVLLALAVPAQAQTEPEIRMFYTVKDPEHRLVLADEKGVEIKTISGFSMDNQWSPDGERILLTIESEDGITPDLVALMGMDLKLKQAAGQPPDFYFYNPVWSADGRNIQVVGMQEGVVLIGADDENYQVVCAEKDDVQISSAYPSPDGSRLAVSGYIKPFTPEVENDVFMMRSDCTAPLRLTTDAPRPIEIRWSPDGRRIAFVTQTEGVTDNKIVVMDADGHNRREFKEGYHYSVSWTEDGKLLATWSDTSVQKERPCFLAVIDPATGLSTVLVKGIDRYFGSAEWRPRKA